MLQSQKKEENQFNYLLMFNTSSRILVMFHVFKNLSFRGGICW